MADLHRLISVVDVGAAAIDSPPPYLPLLADGLCRVVGFEPQTALWPEQTEFVKTYPDIVGDGSEQTLYVSDAPGMTGLYRPSPPMLDALCAKSAGGERWGKVVEEHKVTTRCLDSMDEIPRIDFLKMDCQGAEQLVIQGALEKLAKAVCVHTEVSFVRLYDEQPLFRHVDRELSGLGFIFHTLAAGHLRRISPYVSAAPMRQIIQADAVYVRDFTRMDRMTRPQLFKLALIAERCYRSPDLAFRCREEADKRCPKTASHG